MSRTGSDVLAACTKVAAAQYGVISAAQAVEAGFSPAAIQRLVRIGSWIRVRPRTFALWRSLELAGSLAAAAHGRRAVDG